MNKTLHKMGIVIILGVLTLFSCINFWLKESDIKTKIMLLNLDVRMLKKKIDMIHKETDNTIIENNLSNNIITNSSRDDFLLLINVIAKDYNFMQFIVSISDSKKIDFKKQDFFDMIFTRISMDIKAESEVKIYTFIDEIIDKIPGYVTIKFVKSVKEENVIISSVELDSYTLVSH